LICPAGHAFDVAREGYVNLLSPQHRVRGISGDTADMLQARRRFLDGSHFRPLADRLAAESAGALATLERRRSAPARHPPEPPHCLTGPARACVLEAGCGEGHYIGRIARELGSSNAAPIAFVGMDVSKAAARMAAKRHRNVLVFVGDTHRRIYLRSGSVRVILNVFSPRNPQEFARILEPGGRVLVVIPGEDHLAGLRENLGLLSIQEEKEKRVLSAFSDGFRLLSTTKIHYALELPPSAVEDLVRMGPSQWHRPLIQEDPLPEQTPATGASFVLLHFELR
jgi:23S rRNA (guanine745-N1)-methyltransferase